MAVNMRKHIISKSLPLSYFNLTNGQLYHHSTTIDLCSVELGQTTPLRGRGIDGDQVQLLDHSSLPLSCLLHPPLDYSLHCPYGQVPSTMPHPSSLSFVQEKLLASEITVFSSRVPLFPNFSVQAKALRFNSRAYCRVADSDTGSDGELEDNHAENKCESVDSKTDPKEVDRVCKVIDELFALDRNMEAVLDECEVNLTHDLVVDVLGRYKHARRPAFRFFCWAGQRPGFAHNSRTYNSMMSILGKTKQFMTMVALLDEMGKKGVLNLETFEISIKAFAAAQERKKAVGIFELMKKYNFKAGVDTMNCLLDTLGRAKLGKEAQALFEKLQDKFNPNLRTYTVLLNGWCRVKNLMEAGRVWNEMIDKGFKPDIVAHNTMFEGLLKGKRRSEAMKLFEVMKAKGPHPNVRSYTILIRDLCKQKKMKEAVEYFEEMLDSGFEPDAAVYTCLITGYGNIKKMDKVYGLLKEMKEKGCPPDGQMYNALIKLMTNREMPDDAVRMYKKMVRSGIEPTIHTFNMMMKSYFQTNNYVMGCAVWEEMRKKGCCPDDNSYIVFIGGLIRQGRSVEACKYLEEMLEKGMKAPQLDYNKFAADFSRAGKPQILEELAQKMKFEGKFEVSNIFARWAEMMKNRVKSRNPI